MKRFWDTATVGEGAHGLLILLDGKPLRIPGRSAGTPLALPTRALADAVAAEWQHAGTKGGEVAMDDVPLTRLAGTAQDRIAPDPAPVSAALAVYAESDLLCYRAEHPLPLVVQQAQVWQPWLDWLERTHGARLHVAEGILHRPQDPEALARIHATYARLSVPVLAALGIAVPSMGSAVLGLALADGAIDARTAFEVSNLDELFQVSQWGEDEAAAQRRIHVAGDIALAERFIQLTR